MIYEHFHRDVNVQIVDPAQLVFGRNTYTIVVGKNGVGKSQFLADIAKRSIVYHESDEFEFSDGPKVIAISTSPFDKFPSSRKGVSIRHTNYRYVGMRSDFNMASSAVSLISSAALGLLGKIASGQTSANFLGVFDSLGFEPFVEFIFKPSYLSSSKKETGFEGKDWPVFDELYQSDVREITRQQYVLEQLDLRGIELDRRYSEALFGMREKSLNDVFHAMLRVHEFMETRKAVILPIDFSKDALLFDHYGSRSDLVEAIICLMRHGFLRLMDVRLYKRTHGEMSLKRASSGEQCLLVLMLGIAGHISNDSLILIDEPEISLHPKWQEEFMLLLMHAFSNYHNCQFIVATHSPQILARLGDKGCFVTSLPSGVLQSSKHFARRSADFQLAEVFDAPGLKNEYIARLAFNVLSRVKAAKAVVPSAKKDIQRLVELLPKLDRADPVRELIESVLEACDFYASN